MLLTTIVGAFALPTTIAVDTLATNWDTGVYSAYYGPSNGYAGASPGSTTLYDGREAGIIKAGFGPYPGNISNWDEGLFGFMPNMTIDALAAGILSYDVINEHGTNPVWMTIEVDTGVAGDRTDNTDYQFIPSTNPLSWHTVDAAAGEWQLMDADGNGVGPLMTLGEVAGNNTGLDVVRAYLRLGMGDSYYGTGNGTVAWVDKVILGDVTYDFVAPVLILSGPVSTTIPVSALMNATAGVADSNAEIDAAIVGRTPIQVTLANIGGADSANVRINPIGDGSGNIQFWAKDSLGNWYDINIVGWGPSTGFSAPAGYNATTDVYVFSDTAGLYPVTVELMDVDAAVVVANASGTVNVTDVTISAGASDITSSSVRITALASESVNFTIYYGAGNMTETFDGGVSTTTSVIIGGLLENTTYNYLVKGCITPTICVETPVQSFTTLEAAVVPIDTTPPETSAEAGPYVFGSWSLTPVSVTLSCTDDVACATTYVCVDQTDTCDPAIAGTSAYIDTDGQWYVRYKSVDTSANWETPAKSSTVIIDSVLPTVEANIINTAGTSADVNATSNKIVDFTIFFGLENNIGTMMANVLALDTTNTITTLSGLTPVTMYYYYVSACDGGGRCAYTDVASFTSSVPSVTATTYGETDSSVLFNLTSDVPVNFTIYFGPGNMTSTAMAGNMDTTVNDYMLDELQENTLYNYKVIGCTASGICGPTEPVVKQFTTLGVYPVLNVTIANLTFTGVNFSGSASEPVNWRLQWDTDDNGTYELGTATYGYGVDANMGAGELLPGTMYYYEVQGCDAAGLCSYVRSTFTTSVPDTTPPMIVHGVGDITLSSAIVSGITDEAANITVTIGSDVRSVSGTSFSESFTGLAASTTYVYTIDACDGSMNCASASGSFTTLVPPSLSGESSISDHGSSGGDCSWGYERIDGRCVRMEDDADDFAPEDIPVITVPIPDMGEEDTSGFTPVEVPLGSDDLGTGDLLSGMVTGNGFTTTSWYWLAALGAVIALGLGAYVVVRKH